MFPYPVRGSSAALSAPSLRHAGRTSARAKRIAILVRTVDLPPDSIRRRKAAAQFLSADRVKAAHRRVGWIVVMTRWPRRWSWMDLGDHRLTRASARCLAR